MNKHYVFVVDDEEFVHPWGSYKPIPYTSFNCTSHEVLDEAYCKEDALMGIVDSIDTEAYTILMDLGVKLDEIEDYLTRQGITWEFKNYGDV